jgi:hypothetical protein
MCGYTQFKEGRDRMLLTPQELAELTGYQKPSAQMRWLEAQRITFLVGGDGRPKVLLDLLITRLGGSHSSLVKPEPQLRLDGHKPRREPYT